MKVVPPVIAEVKRIREIFSVHHGVPISQEFVDFANAIGNLCDAAIALAAAAAVVDVPVEAQGKPLCKACHRPKDDSHFHLDAPGKNWGAALHWFEEPDARPAIGPNTYRGEDGSVSVLGTSTGVDARPVTDEQKREMAEWVTGESLAIDNELAEEIVDRILGWPSTGKPTPSEEGK